MTLQYNISVGQAGPRPRGSPATLGSAVAVSIAVHVAAIAIAVLAFGRHAPAAEDPAAITVFVAPAPPAAPEAEVNEERKEEPKKAETPPPPPPEAEVSLPPPEESLAVPDFKSPPPPPPLPPKPAPTPAPRPVPQKPAVAATPQPTPSAPQQQMVPPVNNAPSPAPAPAIVPGWNVRLGAWLRSHQRYPAAARSRGAEGEVLVRFTVDSEGLVTSVAVEKSSGHADLDAAAVTMLQGATVPPPGAAATRTVRVRYSLSD